LFVNFTISDIQNNESGSEMVNQEARSVRSASSILAREHVARLNVETAAVDRLDVIDNTNLYHLRATGRLRRGKFREVARDTDARPEEPRKVAAEQAPRWRPLTRDRR
jgi:hypothetical protein